MSAPHAAAEPSHLLVDLAVFVSDHWLLFLVLILLAVVVYAFRFEILRDEEIAKTKDLWKHLHFYGEPLDWNMVRLVIDEKLHERIERLNHEYESGAIDSVSYNRLVKALLNTAATPQEEKLLEELKAM
ncbi:MAG: hypothetical protein HQK81_08830 [Desulfovibrionaceae bacterium]|nr:hypothetical protein [Desulfovibrionaceae bacterium]MBF0514153.1 hypothetical protein [Desulfovibrionaceae bacterium]